MSSCTFECWGCRKSETHPILHGKEHEEFLVEMASKGWRRKAFWSPNWDKGPWFCSEGCATNSYNAQEAAKYWEEHAQKEFEAYCRSTEIRAAEVLLKFGILCLVFVLAILTGKCIYAGIQ